MKISCPVCGQHFEVEANMLERYFRCTECKTLFCGLNAKVVKERKFRRKSEVADGEEDVIREEFEVAGSTGDTSAAITVETSELPDSIEPEKVKEEYWEEALQKDALERAQNTGKISLDFNLFKWVPVICLVMLVVTFVLALVTNSKVNDLIAGHEEFGSKGASFKKRLTGVEEQYAKSAQQLQQFKSNIDRLTDVCEHINNKVNEQAASGKAGNQEKISAEVKQLYAEIAECKKKIASLEEALRKASAAQKNVQ